MRLSADRSDPGFTRYFDVPPALRGGIVILLDGQKIKQVITADEERGFVMRAARDEKGDLVVKDDALVTERLEGRVQIVMPIGA